MDRFVLISGCSGGGKSTLLSELKKQGCAVVEEPGRRIIAEELKRDGAALPWIDPEAFARRAIETSLEDRAAAMNAAGWVFFDRGLIDAAAALQHVTGEPAIEKFGLALRYNRRIFITPPWPEIYLKDDERHHDFSDAVAEYDRLLAAFSALRYDPYILPKIGGEQRAKLIIDHLKMA